MQLLQHMVSPFLAPDILNVWAQRDAKAGDNNGGDAAFLESLKCPLERSGAIVALGLNLSRGKGPFIFCLPRTSTRKFCPPSTNLRAKTMHLGERNARGGGILRIDLQMKPSPVGKRRWLKA